MKIGTYYYPEQWPREQWERDLDRMAAMGMQLTHLAEFAWGTIEPSPDQFQLDWIDEVLRLCDARNIDVILCTPTAVIPSWLLDQHPDVMWQGLRFGGRRHANHLHPAYRERTRKVVQAMVDRFADHPRVIGWQIDNEFNGGVTDQSSYTHEGFRNWLRAKYGNDIGKLNDAWGNQFWNTYYSSFDQIKYPPGRDPMSEYRNPHETLDAQRFLSWSFADYLKLQSDIIRPRIGSRWISTNFMPFHPELDPADTAKDLDLFSWDTYPISGFGSDFKDERFRIADPDGVGVIHEQMRSFNGRWALMEVQPGQINWSGRPVRPMPGAVRCLLWQAIAHGTEFITVYRFRKPRWGIELWHDGLMQWDGVTPSPGGVEFQQVINEVRQIDEATQTTSPTTYAPMRRDPNVPSIGLLHEHEQIWEYNSFAQAKRWSQSKLVAQYFGAIERLALPATVVRADSDWSKLPVLILPGIQMADEALIARLYDYVRNGGHLITTARSLILDRNGRAPEKKYGEALFELIGSTIAGYDSLPDETFGHVLMNGRKHRWATWSELLDPGENVTTLATFADQYYAGTAAVVRNAYGSGTATHVGAIDEGSLADAVTELIARDAGLPITVLPSRTKLYRMANGVQIFINSSDKSADAPAARDATFLVGAKRVKRADVAIWREPSRAGNG